MKKFIIVMLLLVGTLFASYEFFFNKPNYSKNTGSAASKVSQSSSKDSKDNADNQSNSKTIAKAEESSKNIEALNAEAEKAVNSTGISSSSKYLIYVDLPKQMVYIFKGRINNWKLSTSFECSSGLGSYPDGGGTPTGTFTIASRGSWFYSDKYQEGAEYWTQFKGNYLFHSFPMDKNHNIKDTTLGTPLSHGCIRLAVENAKWINQNIPKGTKVVIK